MNSQNFHIHFVNQGTTYDVDFLEQTSVSKDTVAVNGRHYTLHGKASVIEWLLERIPELSRKSNITVTDLTERLRNLGSQEIMPSPIEAVQKIANMSLVPLSNLNDPGDLSDLIRQDEEAGRKYFLAVYKALHLGEGENLESRLIRSVILSYQKEILFSPSSLKVELPLYIEIQRVLSKSFNLQQTPISSITLISEPERRNRILRIELKNCSEGVIFKESHPMLEGDQIPTEEDMQASYDRFARDWAGLEFASKLEDTNLLCPKCLGGSKEFRFLLQQDLGKNQVTLADRILKGELLEAERALERYMRCLGRLHAKGHSQIDRFFEILHEINPKAPEIDIEKLYQSALEDLRSVFRYLGLEFPKSLEAEVKGIVEYIYDRQGPFTTLIHGDPSPDNVFDYPDKLLLIDFEWASVSSALLDATFPRMNIPTGWCAAKFPEKLLETVELAYREELAKTIPEARDDEAYFRAYEYACAMHLLCQDMAYLPRVYEQDDIWGISSVRSRVLTHLETFIDISAKYDNLPALRSAAKEILTSLRKKWKRAQPLGMYPAFVSQ